MEKKKLISMNICDILVRLKKFLDFLKALISYVLIYVFGHAKSLLWCPTLLDLMDCSLPGCSVHGIFQARILEWVAILFSKGSS